LSTSNQPETTDPDFGGIAAAAETAGDSANEATSLERLTALENRLAQTEPLLEQMQANAALGTALTDYVADLRSEQKFFNRARYAVGCTSLVAVVGLMLLLVLAIFHDSSPLLAAPPLGIVAFVLGLVSGVAILLTSFTKGVFRSTTDRHADGFLPPALQEGIEMFNKITGK
jgi:uncharacterized membrane protein YqjE